MARLTYSAEEIERDHDYARPNEAAGYRMHGGYDAGGRYLSPRTAVRGPAVEAWRAELARRGVELLDATTKLLAAPPYPDHAQQKLLLEHGLGQTFWDQLTNVGKTEARGGVLISLRAPDFQEAVEDDITGTVTDHLNKGLLKTHGMDEAGDHACGQGGHDIMWFAVRDLLFGAGAYPIREPAERPQRPVSGREMPAIPQVHEDFIKSLMNLLMIEIRAENFFQFCSDVIRDKDLFRDRRAKADLAARIVDQIRQDETIHVSYLQAFLSELRAFTFKTAEGGRVKGGEILDPVWERIVRWHAAEVPKMQREEQRSAILDRIAGHADGRKLAEAFDALAG